MQGVATLIFVASGLHVVVAVLGRLGHQRQAENVVGTPQAQWVVGTGNEWGSVREREQGKQEDWCL